MENKKVILNYFIIGLIVLGVAFLGVTYAYWSISINQKGKNIVNTVCLEVSMEKEGEAISIPKALPIEDSEGEELSPFQFTIHNKCNDNASYQINLESMSKNGDLVIEEKNRLNPKYLKFKLNEVEKSGIIGLLTGSKENDTTKVDKTIQEAYEAHKLTTGYLKPNETKNFELRLWLDKDADEGAISKVFVSKVTITNSYLDSDKIPPTANLELAVCDMEITATGSGIVSGNKTIKNYSYKIDGKDWETSTSSTKSFTVDSLGKHTVSLKATDNKELVSEEITKEIEVEIKEPEMVEIAGMQIPLATCKNGLYKVEHNEETTLTDNGWKKEEYRYAGVNYTDPNTSYVHNYVKFNNEKWRIIGLVNVKTEEGTIDQRLKIVRTDGIDGQFDFGSYYWDTSTNNWTTSTLKQCLTVFIIVVKVEIVIKIVVHQINVILKVEMNYPKD